MRIPDSAARRLGTMLETGLTMRGNRRYTAACCVAICSGLLGVTLMSVLLAAIAQFVPVAQWGKSAAGALTDAGPLKMLLLAVLYAPLFETVIGQVLPIEVARRLRMARPWWIFMGAALFGIGHFLNGGIMHGMTAFLAGLNFSYAYVFMRPSGPGPAFTACAGAHAVHNATLIFIIGPLFPGSQ